MYTTKASFAISEGRILLSQPKRKMTFAEVEIGLKSIPNSKALISPWLLCKTLNPFHPL